MYINSGLKHIFNIIKSPNILVSQMIHLQIKTMEYEPSKESDQHIIYPYLSSFTSPESDHSLLSKYNGLLKSD